MKIATMGGMAAVAFIEMTVKTYADISFTASKFNLDPPMLPTWTFSTPGVMLPLVVVGAFLFGKELKGLMKLLAVMLITPMLVAAITFADFFRTSSVNRNQQSKV